MSQADAIHRAKRILVVEDDDVVRRCVVRIVARHGDTVVAVSCCLEARTAGAFDIGVFDVDLPDGDGIELATELLDGGQVKRVVFYTGRDPGRAEGVGPVVLKGSPLDELLRVVHPSAERG